MHYNANQSYYLINYFAQVAQLVEQATENRCVGGSIPPLGTTIYVKQQISYNFITYINSVL